MYYAPTLGGIMRLRNKMAEIGFPLPIFEVEIYERAEFVIMFPLVEGCRYRSGPGRRENLDDLIKRKGAHRTVWDCRLSSDDGNRKLEFAHPRWTPMTYNILGYRHDNWVHAEVYFPPEDAESLRHKDCLKELANIARWGKSNPSRWDRFALKFLPFFYRFPATGL